MLLSISASPFSPTSIATSCELSHMYSVKEWRVIIAHQVAPMAVTLYFLLTRREKGKTKTWALLLGLYPRRPSIYLAQDGIFMASSSSLGHRCHTCKCAALLSLCSCGRSGPSFTHNIKSRSKAARTKCSKGTVQWAHVHLVSPLNYSFCNAHLHYLPSFYRPLWVTFG